MAYAVKHNIKPGQDGLTADQPIECSDDEEDAAAIDAQIAKLKVSHSWYANQVLR